jgi:hypothetical protein
MARTTAAKAVTVKIPQHKTPDGRWCLFSGCDSTTGICRMCEPEPPSDVPSRIGTCAWCGTETTVYAYAEWACKRCLDEDPARSKSEAAR